MPASPSPTGYDPDDDMVAQAVGSGNYHSNLPAASTAHGTRATGQWILRRLDELSAADAAEQADLAEPLAALDRLLSLQDADPVSRTFGVWPYYLEEPLERMVAPDFNWADFLGLDLLRVLHRHGGRLGPELAGRCEQAIERAALAIFRRNVTHGYTNICALGAAVCGLAGARLGRPWMVHYATRRLGRMVEAMVGSGAVPEYNSPTYYPVAIEAAEVILDQSADDALRSAAGDLHGWMWRQITDAWHPATRQWAGPFARAYSDLLRPRSRRWLATRLRLADDADVGGWIGDEVEPGPRKPETLPPPPGVAGRFAALPEPEVRQRLPLVRGDAMATDTTRGATRWLGQRMCLATVDVEDTWDQRRTLLGYAAVADHQTPAVLRVRLTHNGRSFASGRVQHAQDGPGALCVFGLTQGRGDWHVNLDRPADGRFELSRLAVHVELRHPQATVQRWGDDRYCLAAGDVAAEVVTGPAVVDGRAGTWQDTSREGVAEVVCGVSLERDEAVALQALGPTWWAVGVRWLVGEGGDVAVSAEAVSTEVDGDQVHVRWGQLAVSAPVDASAV